MPRQRRAFTDRAGNVFTQARDRRWTSPTTQVAYSRRQGEKLASTPLPTGGYHLKISRVPGWKPYLTLGTGKNRLTAMAQLRTTLRGLREPRLHLSVLAIWPQAFYERVAGKEREEFKSPDFEPDYTGALGGESEAELDPEERAFLRHMERSRWKVDDKDRNGQPIGSPKGAEWGGAHAVDSDLLRYWAQPKQSRSIPEFVQRATGVRPLAVYQIGLYQVKPPQRR